MKELTLCSKCNTMKNIEGFNDCAKCMEQITMTTENWREEFDKEWKEGLLICFGYENPESSREKRVVAEQVYFKLISSIEALLSKKHNEVLDEVKKEVEELNKLSLCGKCEISTKNELSHI